MPIDQETITHVELAERLQAEPLLFAKIVTGNNPQAVSNNLKSAGITDSDLSNPDLLDVLTNSIPELSSAEVAEMLNVPFCYDTSCEASNPGVYAAFEHVRREAGIPEDQASWGALFPDTAVSVKPAYQDFVGNDKLPAPAASAKRPCTACGHARMRRLIDYATVAAVIVFVILIIKKW